MIKSAITHITVQDNISLITVDGLSAESHTVLKIFNSVADRGINVDMISMSLRHKNRMDLSFTVANDSLGEAVTAMGELRHDIPQIMCHISGNNAKITLSGTAVSEEMGVTAKVLKVLADNDVPVKLISASVNEISLLVDEIYLDTAVLELEKTIRRKP